MNARRADSIRAAAWDAALAGLMAAAVLAIFVVAPTEETMGHAQRIVYVHVAVAWCALLGFLATAVTGAIYLARRNLAWDHWSEAAAESGWLCATLTLATGSLWARAAWGAWWTWDPRLTATFVLWAIYSGYLLVRAGVEDPHRRARLGAVVAILGAVDLPMVVMATRWFRAMHPASPAMEPRMRLALWVSVVGFTALFATLVARRRVQLRLRQRLATDDGWLAADRSEAPVASRWGTAPLCPSHPFLGSVPEPRESIPRDEV